MKALALLVLAVLVAPMCWADLPPPLADLDPPVLEWIQGIDELFNINESPALNTAGNRFGETKTDEGRRLLIREQLKIFS